MLPSRAGCSVCCRLRAAGRSPSGARAHPLRPARIRRRKPAAAHPVRLPRRGQPPPGARRRRRRPLRRPHLPRRRQGTLAATLLHAFGNAGRDVKGSIGRTEQLLTDPGHVRVGADLIAQIAERDHAAASLLFAGTVADLVLALAEQHRGETIRLLRSWWTRNGYVDTGWNRQTAETWLTPFGKTAVATVHADPRSCEPRQDDTVADGPPRTAATAACGRCVPSAGRRRRSTSVNPARANRPQNSSTGRR